MSSREIKKKRYDSAVVIEKKAAFTRKVSSDSKKLTGATKSKICYCYELWKVPSNPVKDGKFVKPPISEEVEDLASFRSALSDVTSIARYYRSNPASPQK